MTSELVNIQNAWMIHPRQSCIHQCVQDLPWNRNHMFWKCAKK